MAALAASISSTSSVDAPAAIIASAASMRLCFASWASAYSRCFEAGVPRRKSLVGFRPASMDLADLLLAAVVSDLLSTLSRNAALSAEPWSPAWLPGLPGLPPRARFRALSSFRGACRMLPSFSKASARARLVPLSTDMSLSNLWMTLESVNSMSRAVTLQNASWNSGMQSLNDSCISASAPPGAHWPPSPPAPPSPAGAPDEAAPPKPLPSAPGTSSGIKFSSRSFLRPPSGIICTMYLWLSSSKPTTMPTSLLSSAALNPRSITSVPGCSSCA
mmetsp:Transcript_34919/g.93521  ORF Transcript_34919/g.93521 Transcript_34919/m.93521 type:complete len:275 (-) Transcript_34919:604-1428(-)